MFWGSKSKLNSTCGGRRRRAGGQELDEKRRIASEIKALQFKAASNKGMYERE